MQTNQHFSLSVAPMMDWTDRHCRYFHRLLTHHTRLYTEMVTAEAIIHGDRDYLLGFDASEHPVALQLGGSDPAKLAIAAKVGADYGYDEINLNVGCPSDRVQSGAFGACLMKSPDLVASCVRAMREQVNVPVTVKCRIGVDDQDPAESLFEFIDIVAQSGCQHFIVHARKAWLKGLSPKDNRTVPPLDYNIVRAVKKANPQLTITLNGGLETLDQCRAEICNRGDEKGDDLDGVMLGRAPYANPWLLTDVDEQFFNAAPFSLTRRDIALLMNDYIHRECRKSREPFVLKPHAITRHLFGLFHGTPGAKTWRRMLSTQGAKTPINIIETALLEMDRHKVSAIEVASQDSVMELP